MKKNLFFTAAVLLLISAAAMAQNVRLNAYSSYVFDDAVDSYYDNSSYYNGKIQGGYQWGAGLEFMAHPNYGVELSYLRHDTKAPMNFYSGGPKSAILDLGINYIMLGGNRYFSKPGGKVEGFGGKSLGADIISINNPTNNNSSTKTFFAWGLKGGMNVWAAEKVGIKLQASLLSAVQSVGGGFYFGTGGAGAGISSYSTMYQFCLGGGLTFKLGGAAKK